jgi:5-methylcytosine-specific restriction endonuclease McrA
MGKEGPLQLTRTELRTIQHNLRDMHARHASTAKHLLLRLNDAKAGKPVSSSLPDDMTVEHVLPKKFGRGSEWRRWHPDAVDRELCTDCLGNLVLVTKDQNDRAGNRELGHKLDVYFNTANAPVVALNADLHGRKEWKSRDIRAREADLLHLIEELWQFGVVVPRAQAAE